MPRLTLTALALAACLGAALPARAADAIDGVLTPYLRIQAQLADDRTDAIKADAETLATAAAGLGAPGQPMAAAAQELSAAANLGAARESFGKLSDALIAYADQSHAALGATTATAYCPMARKSWLQQGDAIKNPYFGKGMLGCGTIKKKG